MGYTANGTTTNQWNGASEDELLASALLSVEQIKKVVNSLRGASASLLSIDKVERSDKNGNFLYLEFQFKIALEKRGKSVNWSNVFSAVKRVKQCHFTRS